MSLKRVAVIGAGAAGICAAKNLRQQNLDVVVFESSKSAGGTWDLANPNSSMYQNLGTNLPPPVMEYPDHPFTYPGFDTSNSFPSHSVVQAYLEGYVSHFDITPMIRYSTTVVEALFDEEERRWDLSFQKKSKPELVTEHFDALVVCNGHYSEAKLPSIPGISAFQKEREVIHSHLYKVPEPFANKKVVVMGAGASGIDISLDIALNCPKSSVILSHRKGVKKSAEKSEEKESEEKESEEKESEEKESEEKESEEKESEDKKSEEKSEENSDCKVALAYGEGVMNLTQTPTLSRVDPDTLRVFFDDGSWEDGVDTILFCTGYHYSFPFLSKQMARDEHNLEISNREVRHLYKHVFSIHRPTLSFVGLPFKVAPFPLFHYQTKAIAAVLSNKTALPSPQHMLQDLQANRAMRKEMGLPPSYNHMLAHMQWGYNDEMANLAGLEGQELEEMKAVEEVREQIYNDCGEARLRYPMVYRERVYKVNRPDLKWSVEF